MEKHNFVETLSSLKMDQAKEAASSLQNKWSGLDQTKSAVAGSYTDGKSTEINESASFNNPNTSFPLGLLKNILALRNGALSDLPEAKIVLEKYLNALTVKGIDEGLLIESFIAELTPFNWENSARKTLKNLTSVVESNSKEIEVVKAIDGLRRSGGRNLFSDIEKSMINWLKSGNRVFESLTLELKRWTFNPIVKGLLHNVSILESKNSGKFALRTDNTNCEVKAIVAPSLVKESYSVHVIGGRFLKVSGNQISLYNKAAATGNQIFFENTSGTEFQLTGNCSAAGNGYTMLFGGIIMKWGAVSVGPSATATITFDATVPITNLFCSYWVPS